MAAQFKVGGKVVAIDEGVTTASDKAFSVEIKKGEVYTVRSLKPCGCGSLLLDLGFERSHQRNVKMILQCGECNSEYETNIVFLDSQYIVPLEETEFRAVTYTKILEEIPQAAN